MLKRKLLLAALATSAIGLAPLPSFAAVSVYVDVAPPAVRYEVVPASRPGHVWQEGYWDWSKGRHVWHKGYWVKERRGYYWHPSRWENDGGRYRFVRGDWGRERYAMRGDLDRDGIPNRLDRDKDGDGVRNNRDRDRDGDGVPNRVDRRPDNPNRR